MSNSYISAAIRQFIYQRANGLCEYCQIAESMTLFSHQIDHIIAEKHGGLTDENNLALSCAICNKYKGSDIASVDEETNQIIPLYHPRRDNWANHFQLTSAGVILPLTTQGRVTAKLLQFNRAERVMERYIQMQL